MTAARYLCRNISAVKIGLPGYPVLPGDDFEITDGVEAVRFQDRGLLQVLAKIDGDTLTVGSKSFKVIEEPEL